MTFHSIARCTCTTMSQFEFIEFEMRHAMIEFHSFGSNILLFTICFLSSVYCHTWLIRGKPGASIEGQRGKERRLQAEWHLLHSVDKSLQNRYFAFEMHFITQTMIYNEQRAINNQFEDLSTAIGALEMQSIPIQWCSEFEIQNVKRSSWHIAGWLMRLDACAWVESACHVPTNGARTKIKPRIGGINHIRFGKLPPRGRGRHEKKFAH